jgi:hypothetical protein
MVWPSAEAAGVVNRYWLERTAFEKVHKFPDIVKTADLIEAGNWFSWRLCFKRLKAIPKTHRPACMKLLRVAQKQRVNTGDPELRALHSLMDSKIDPFQCFIAPISPAVYMHRLQPVVLDGQRIGLTIKAERMKGNRVRVFYHAPKETRAVRFEKAEAIAGPSSSPYLAEQGFYDYSTRFHVKELTAGDKNPQRAIGG